MMTTSQRRALRFALMVCLGCAVGCSGSKTITDDEVSLDTPFVPECTLDDQCAHRTTNCAKGVCDLLTNECTTTLRPWGSPCDVELECALGRCISGVCSPEIVLNCDDNNPCTNDVCDMVKGCLHTAKISSCDDNNPCTKDDTCTNGTCTAGDYICDQCTDDSDCTPYNDQDACNGQLACDTTINECHVVTDSVAFCNSTNPCMTSLCNAASGQCEEHPRPNGSTCSDSDLCTLEDRCFDGECTGATLTCPPPGNTCIAATCEAKTACTESSRHGQPCHDGNQCTVDDLCHEDLCAGTTVETCVCLQDSDCTLYDDDNLCNGIVRCMDGQCLIDPNTIPHCIPPSAPCLSVQCIAATGKCETGSMEGPCADGDLCTTNDHCVDGLCIGEAAVCDDGDDCTVDLCDSSQGCMVELIPDCVSDTCKNGKVGLCGACGFATCVDENWGPCENEKTCLAGTMETESCGNCGEHTRTCQAGCEWGDFGECLNEKTCAPQEESTQSCGQCAVQTRTCSEACEWGEYGECTAVGSCTPGESETQGCGNCGSQSRTCADSCEWDGWSDCGGQGPCSPGASQGCGECGSQSCGGNCQWGSCQGEGCTPCPTWAATWSAPNGWTQWNTDCKPGCGHGNDCNCNGENWCKPGGSYKDGESAKLWSNGCDQPFVWITCTVKYQ